MTPLCISLGEFTQEQIDTWKQVCKFVENLIATEDVSCHAICFAVSNEFSQLVWYSGHFGGVNEHSWLMFRDDPYVIIDPYPIAIASGPILLTTNGSVANPWYRIYNGEEVRR